MEKEILAIINYIYFNERQKETDAIYVVMECKRNMELLEKKYSFLKRVKR